jgi:isoleucyl-tRNA synthetase
VLWPDSWQKERKKNATSCVKKKDTLYTMEKEYRATIFLPQTPFPMKAGLPQKEPQLLAFWETFQLSHKQRQARVGAPKFVLHDGPPYANGHLHMGHAVNKILKDVTNRSQFMLGKDVVFVPGWDCHGLPIEWKVEEAYREKSKKKDAVDPVEFRQACRTFAQTWLDIQRREFQRLGLMGEWDNPYSTMDFKAEASIVAQFLALVEKGYVYRGVKPVLWSVVEGTALAEAEVEYQEVTSPSLYVRFPFKRVPKPLEAVLGKLQGFAIFAVIWTTTPWTLPGNRAIAYHPALTYVLIQVKAVAQGARLDVGDLLLLAEDLLQSFKEAVGLEDFLVLHTCTGASLEGVVCHHPLASAGYGVEVPLLPGAHVTADTGTGLVHTAPGHGLEDFEVGRTFGLEIPETVLADGLFVDSLPIVGGAHVYKANPLVIEALKTAGTLVSEKPLRHSYPHSWRSKTPLIYRTTSQWFVAMDGEGKLREKALQAIEAVAWYPPQAKNRIKAMVEGRPDWCLSRQRAWGVPLTLFVHKQTQTLLQDPRVHQRILDIVRQEGTEAWFASPSHRFLDPFHDPQAYEKVTDILDVWFDSGVTHAFVLRDHPELQWPASLYLEGSDQHRGWFQSSLLTACALHGQAPYQAVVTHGFVVNDQGHKMSKSAGNATSPQQLTDELGADLLRLWVVSVDSQEDMRIGPDILKHLQDLYRRLRNTLRYLLGAVDGFSEEEAVPYEAMPELEQWVCHRLKSLEAQMRQTYESYRFQSVFQEIHQFCAVDLSAFYLDLRKDSLYCDAASTPKRRAARTVMLKVLECLCQWLAPLLVFTTEEAWQALKGPETSVHLEAFPALPEGWLQPALGDRYQTLRHLRQVVTGALELARASKHIGSSLQASATVYLHPTYAPALKDLDFAAFCLTSALALVWTEAIPAEAYHLSEVEGVGVTIEMASGEKCLRCWKVLPEVAQHSGALCGRCQDAV